MKKSLLPLFIFFSSFSYAQFFFIPKEVGETAPGAYPNVQISAINIPAGARYQRANVSQDGNGYFQFNFSPTLYSSGDFIYGLSENAIVCDIESAWFMAFSEFDPGFEFQVLSWQDVSAAGATDGTLTIVTDSPASVQLSRMISNFQAGAAYSSQQLNDSTVMFTGLGNESVMLTNLASGKRTGGRFGPMNYSGAAGFTIDVLTTDAAGVCNGSATVVPAFNAVGSITCNWSFIPDVPGSTQGGLCPGIYQVTATDELGQVAVKEFPVAGEEYVYDEDVPAGFEEDTIIELFIPNCELDYTLDIDSADMNVNLISDNGASQLVSVELVIYQAGNEYFYSDTFEIVSGTNVLFNATVYCEELKSTFHGLTFRYGYRTSSLSVADKEPGMIIVYPNPANSLINIMGLESPEGILTDISGKSVMKITSAAFSIEDLENGVYLLNLNNTSKTIRIVKQ